MEKEIIKFAGTVVHGKGLGRTVGMPTANILVPNGTKLPPNGVYTTITYIGDKAVRGITNIGTRPTVDNDDERTIETFLQDFSKDIYGETITTEIHQFIRKIKKFHSLEEVHRQVQRDIEAMEKPYLERDQLAHIDMLEVIRRGTADVLEDKKEGMLLYDREGEVYMLSTESVNLAKCFIRKIDKPKLLVAHQEFMIPMLQERFPLKKILTCHQAAWFAKEPPAVSFADLDIRILTIDMAETIINLYSNHMDSEYIKERLNKQALFGAFMDNQLAGFIGTHAEGSMGLLEVRAEFQRQGIGEKLVAFLINRIQAEGKIPFSQVVVGNKASRALHEKMGFEISKNRVYWLEE